MEFISEIIGVVCGGGIGALIMQLYTAGVNKQKLKEEANGASLDNARKKQDAQQDAYDAAYTQLSRCLDDYHKLNEEFNQYVANSRKFELEVQSKINEKCTEIAKLKSEITYLKGLRCYKSDCSKRVCLNPEKAMKVEETKEAENS